MIYQGEWGSPRCGCHEAVLMLSPVFFLFLEYLIHCKNAISVHNN